MNRKKELHHILQFCKSKILVLVLTCQTCTNPEESSVGVFVGRARVDLGSLPYFLLGSFTIWEISRKSVCQMQRHQVGY